MHKAKSYHRCVARLFLSQGLGTTSSILIVAVNLTSIFVKEVCLHGADSGPPYPGRKYFNHFKVTADDTLETRLVPT